MTQEGYYTAALLLKVGYPLNVICGYNAFNYIAVTWLSLSCFTLNLKLVKLKTC